jgi:hypothetical protein
MTLSLRYWETRRLANAGDVITGAVVRLGRERVPLTIESSRVVAGRLESIASATASLTFVAKLLASGQASFTVATLTKFKEQTAIRVGMTGLGQVLPQLTAGCPR